MKSQLTPVKEEITARAVNGNMVQYYQKLLLPIEVQHQVHDVHAYFSDVLPYNLVLGYDYLRQVEVTVDFGRT